MRIEIKGEESRAEPVLRLWLKRNGDGSVSLMGSDQAGDGGYYLISFRPDGKVMNVGGLEGLAHLLPIDSRNYLDIIHC
jgi:hypothetical protein